MTKVTLFKQDGTTNGEIELNSDIFGIEPNENVVFDAVIMQRASLRQGTHAVKNRSAVSGGGRKPWRQKGTGRARQGSIRSPQWRGGGIVFGPTPRSYSYKLPKKVRRLAIKSVLSQKVLDNKLVVVEALQFDAPKTKEFAQVLSNLNVDTKVLVVVESSNDFALLSARNIPNVTIVDETDVTVLDVVNNDKLLFTKAALSKVEEGLQYVIKRPIITEASMLATDEKKYTFEVDVRANKIQVRQAVEEIFGVKVEKVNILNVRAKFKRVGRYGGYTNKRRKAIVKLTKDSKDIQLFAEEA